MPISSSRNRKKNSRTRTLIVRAEYHSANVVRKVVRKIIGMLNPSTPM